MSERSKKNHGTPFICPFCHCTIKAANKTEIHYRNEWIFGCYECFGLSINKDTALLFQQKEY